MQPARLGGLLASRHFFGRMFYASPKVLTEPSHVRFAGFIDYSLDLEIVAYPPEG